MNEVLNANKKVIIPIEWNGVRVITSSQLAKVYGTEDNNIKNNYSNNKEKFVEGVHYYLLKGPELRDFKNSVNGNDLVDKHAPSLYLWTRRGASRHCKILDTGKAWEQFDALEAAYFNSRPVPATPSCIEDVLIQSLQEMKDIRSRVDRQSEAIQTVKTAMTQVGQEESFSKWVSESIKAIANSPDFDDNPFRYQTVWGESYKRLTDRAGCNLSVLLRNAKKRAAENGATKTAIKNISKLSVVESNKRLKELYISCIREMMVAYCVEVS